jgi:osmotically-inducible protein OsmY
VCGGASLPPPAKPPLQNFGYLLVFSHPHRAGGGLMAHARLVKQHTDRAGSARLSDAQIAAEATRRLAWDDEIPRNAVKVQVSRGRITLRGELLGDRQRLAALEDVTRLFGVTGVSDHTVVKTR